MSNIFRIAYIDFKTSITKINLFLCYFIIAAFMAIWLIRSPREFLTEDYLYMYFRILNIVMIYLCTYIYAKDYNSGVYKFIYTGRYTRNEILHSKVIIVLLYTFFFWVIRFVFQILFSVKVNKSFNLMDILSEKLCFSIIIYAITFLVIGSFAMMISSITLNYISTVVITFLTFGLVQYLAPVYISVEKGISKGIYIDVLTRTPMYIILKWSQLGICKIEEVVWMCGYGLLFYIIARILMSQRDLAV